MPTINKKRKPQQKYVPTERSKASAEFYNTQTWRRLRNAYMLGHPLCQMCEAQGKVVPAEEIHHILPISGGKDKLEMRYRAFDPNNLIALCKECHHKVHTQLKRNKIEQRDLQLNLYQQ